MTNERITRNRIEVERPTTEMITELKGEELMLNHKSQDRRKTLSDSTKTFASAIFWNAIGLGLILLAVAVFAASVLFENADISAIIGRFQ